MNCLLTRQPPLTRILMTARMAGPKSFLNLQHRTRSAAMIQLPPLPSGDLMGVVVRLFMRQASPTRTRGAARRELHEPLPWRSLPAHGDQLHVFSLDFALGQ